MTMHRQKALLSVMYKSFCNVYITYIYMELACQLLLNFALTCRITSHTSGKVSRMTFGRQKTQVLVLVVTHIPGDLGRPSSHSLEGKPDALVSEKSAHITLEDLMRWSEQSPVHFRMGFSPSSFACHVTSSQNPDAKGRAMSHVGVFKFQAPVTQEKKGQRYASAVSSPQHLA